MTTLTRKQSSRMRKVGRPQRDRLRAVPSAAREQAVQS